MPRIRCRYIDCVYLESGYCGADQIDLDPEMGCLTYAQEEEDLPKDEEWEEEEELEEEEWEEDLDEDFEDLDEDEDEDEEW
jgi:hypothetical protein